MKLENRILFFSQMKKFMLFKFDFCYTIVINICYYFEPFITLVSFASVLAYAEYLLQFNVSCQFSLTSWLFFSSALQIFAKNVFFPFYR